MLVAWEVDAKVVPLFVCVFVALPVECGGFAVHQLGDFGTVLNGVVTVFGFFEFFFFFEPVFIVIDSAFFHFIIECICVELEPVHDTAMLPSTWVCSSLWYPT